jgi:hypothetical protein
LEELIPLEDVVYVVFSVCDIHASELDPSPALGGDDPNIPRGEGLT